MAYSGGNALQAAGTAEQQSEAGLLSQHHL